MIVIFLAYILFQIIYDHWGQSGALWDAIYFIAQFSTLAALAFVQWAKTRKYAYMLVAFFFVALTANEITYLQLDATTYKMMTSGPPALAMTIIGMLLFIIFEIITRWKKRQSA